MGQTSTSKSITPLFQLVTSYLRPKQPVSSKSILCNTTVPPPRGSFALGGSDICGRLVRRLTRLGESGQPSTATSTSGQGTIPTKHYIYDQSSVLPIIKPRPTTVYRGWETTSTENRESPDGSPERPSTTLSKSTWGSWFEVAGDDVQGVGEGTRAPGTCSVASFVETGQVLEPTASG